MPPQICKSSRFPGRVSRPRLSIESTQAIPALVCLRADRREICDRHVDNDNNHRPRSGGREQHSNAGLGPDHLPFPRPRLRLAPSLREGHRHQDVRQGRCLYGLVSSTFSEYWKWRLAPILTTTAALCNGRMDRIHHTSAARIGQTPRHNFGGGQHDLLAGRFLPVDYLGHLGARLPQDLDCLQPPSAEHP